MRSEIPAMLAQIFRRASDIDNAISARTIPVAVGDVPEPLLEQVALIPRCCYLQHFLRPEPKDWFHRHRWSWATSIVLSGQYAEERVCRDAEGEPDFGHVVTLVYEAGETRDIPSSLIHRIDFWSPECWTLLFCGDETEDWGYYKRGEWRFIPWQEAIEPSRRVDSI